MIWSKSLKFPSFHFLYLQKGPGATCLTMAQRSEPPEGCEAPAPWSLVATPTWAPCPCLQVGFQAARLPLKCWHSSLTTWLSLPRLFQPLRRIPPHLCPACQGTRRPSHGQSSLRVLRLMSSLQGLTCSPECHPGSAQARIWESPLGPLSPCMPPASGSFELCLHRLLSASLEASLA